jgi:hypothetical protein
MRTVTVAAMSLSLFGIVTLAGCGSGAGAKGPATVPVQGKVVFARGGDSKALFSNQCRIEFDCIERPGVRAVGQIEEDGTFTVATIVEGAGSIGAVPGTHRVRLDVDERLERLVAPQFLSFEKSGITIKLPSDQPLEIKVWR